MAGTCEACGGDVTAKNMAGHFRKKCWDCILDESAKDPPHRNPEPPDYDR